LAWEVLPMPFAVDQKLFDGEDSPVRYDLIFRIEDGKPTFVLSVPTDILGKISPDAPLFGIMKERLPGIGDFVISEKELGFGGVFSACEPLFPIDGFPSWKATVPERVIVPIESNGQSDWDSAYRLSATLHVVAFAYQFRDPKPNPMGTQQLATFALACQPEMHGAELSLTLSPVARQWIVANCGRSKKMALEAMITTYRRMWPDYFREDEQFRLHGFRAESRYENKQFILDVPGDACGIYIDGMELDDGPGWNFNSHNVDSPIQQLSLLAGICSILYRIRLSQLH